MELSAQTGQTTVVEKQEKIYQRLQILKEMYYPHLKELYLRLHFKSQQPMPDNQLDKLQGYKVAVNSSLQLIQLPRSSIPPGMTEEKLDAFEMRVQSILSQAWLRSALQQQGQQIPPQAGSQVQSIQQSQLQIPQMQQEKHVNHLQQMNSQVPTTSMQSNTVPPIQHSSMQMFLQSGLQTSQQNTLTAMQPGANLNSTQGAGVGTFQQSSVSSLQHNNNSYALQQNNSAIQQNSNSLQQGGISTLQQNNLNPIQLNANALHHHQAIKQQELLQVQHQKILLAQHQPLQQSQQFLQQHLQRLQQKQQQAAQLQAQFQAQQMPQLQQINDMSNDVKLKQVATVKQTLMQQNHSLAQLPVYQQQQQQFKTGTSLSVSSPPLLLTASPQVSQQSFPQIGQQNLIASSLQIQVPKVGSRLQQMTSEDAEKQSSAFSSISNVGCGRGVQQTATAQAISTPGISASPLLDGFSSTRSHNIVNQEQTVSAGLLMENKSSTEEPSFEHLIKVPMLHDQLHKLQGYKVPVNSSLQLIQLPRSSIQPGMKEEKLDDYEMQVQTMLSQARLRVSALEQQGQQQIRIPPQAGSQVQSIQQSQLPQMQQEKHVNHLQQMNSQVSMTSIQSNTVPPIQHSSIQMLLQSGLQTSQQNILTAMQPGANLNSTQGTGVGTFHQNSVSALEHNNNNYALQQNNSAIQQNSINSLQQNGISTLQQNNLNPIQSNANALHHHHAIKQQEMLQAQHQKILLVQQQQQQQQPLQQSQQFLQHLQQLQQKQQQAGQLQAQFQAQQMPQLQQFNDMSNDVKLKQAATVKKRLMQKNHSLAQLPVYQQQQQQFKKTGTSVSVSSPPLLSTASPQASRQSSPQIGQQNSVASSLQVQVPKVGSPLQQMTSEDAEKQSSAFSSISNVGCGQGVQQTATALAIGTPGISASPLLDGFSPTPSHDIVNQEQTISAGLLKEDKSSTEESPFNRLIKVINRMSRKALASAVNDIGSVVSLMDRMAGSAPGNGSRAAVGEDLAATTKSRLQARNLMSQDDNAATKKMKRYMNSIPLSTVSSGGTVTNSFHRYNNEESPEIKSTATSRFNRPRLEMSHVLQEELQEIYQQLIDTAVEISEDDDDAVALAAEGRDGVVLKCYYNAIALSPNMKSHYGSSQMTSILPLRLLIPADYPNSSPVLLDKASTESCKEYVDLSSKARAKFHAAVQTLPQPMSIMALAKTWDVSARSTVVEYAHQSGGGSFSSCFGTWENCTNA